MKQPHPSYARTIVPRPRTSARRTRPTVMVAALVATVALVLAACGQTPSITLSLDAARAELLRGGDVQVEVTLTRLGGATADVALTVTGLPANVDASFAPATLSGGALTSTLTLSAAAAAVEDVYDLTVTATGTGLTATAPLTLDVVSLTVTGRIVSLFDLPVSGVIVDSQGDTDVTDANGEFTLRGLSVPYDLTAWSLADTWMHVFEQLTADEVRLSSLFAVAIPALARTAAVSGTLTGGVMPVPAGHEVIVCLEGLDGVVLGCDSVAPTENSYSIPANWGGPATRQARLHALQVNSNGTEYPVSYPGYATMDVTLTDATPTVADLDLGSALPTTTVDVDVDAPVAITNTSATVEFGTYLEMAVANIASPVTAHAFVMPVIDDASHGFIATTADSRTGWLSDVTGSTATVVVPDVPTLVSPADATVDVTNSTEFTAANPTGGPLTYTWNIAGGPSLALTTMSTSHVMPDPEEFGVTIPAAANGGWQVIAGSGPSTENGASVIADYFNALFIQVAGASPGPKGDGTIAQSSSTWSFMTAP